MYKGNMNETMMAETTYKLLLKMIVLVCLDCHDKIPKTGWLEKQTFSSHCSDGWKVQYLGIARFSDDPLLAYRWLSSHCVFTWWGERTSKIWPPFLFL